MSALNDINKLSKDDLLKALAAAQAENDALKKSKSRALTLKVSAKGAVSLYGMGRWPVTLYKTQWEKVLDMADDIRQFLKDNDSQLATKA